jgi:hypothetical protein
MPMPPVPPGLNAISSKVTQSVRTDIPPDLERIVVDGGVREGKPENPYTPNLAAAAGLAILLILGLAAMGMVVRYLTTGQFP